MVNYNNPKAIVMKRTLEGGTKMGKKNTPSQLYVFQFGRGDNYIK